MNKYSFSHWSIMWSNLPCGVGLYRLSSARPNYNLPRLLFFWELCFLLHTYTYIYIYIHTYFSLYISLSVSISLSLYIYIYAMAIYDTRSIICFSQLVMNLLTATYAPNVHMQSNINSIRHRPNPMYLRSNITASKT